ncbi:uncharacterized protein Tco025E_02105 [Trypanosoma conorhini]|uniref:Uncharacterized protein n=1 Tax=Trypanosoma conorhini TaxID=83891 RepID=A0A422Q6M0_9TRYP|nr:uncharacterized protein Tco025E_02105 [Trypanosoma conorhini]RNF25609.1 hypothetical protein Tco025E_02105 [Trypanosoma conorhini]
MLQLSRRIREACQQRLGAGPDEEQRPAEEPTPPLATLLRRLRAEASEASVRQPLGAALPAAATPPKPLKPVLYPTPDGALRPASVAPERPRDSRREKSSPRVQGAEDAGVAACIPSPSFTASVDDDAEAPLRRRPSLAAAVDGGLMETLSCVCAPAAVGSETKAATFTLEERVEALYTIVYLVFHVESVGRRVRLDAAAARRRSNEETMGNASFICKIDLLQLSATACDLLRRVVGWAWGAGGAPGEEESGEGVEAAGEAQAVRALVAVSNAISILLGCRSLRHWQQESEAEAEAWELEAEAAGQELGCCLCCDADSLSSRSLLAALTEQGLWQYLLRHVAFSVLPRLGAPCEQHASHVEGPAAGEEATDVSGARRVARTFGVQLTLKMMALLFLRSTAAAEPDLSGVLCRLTPAEEEELDARWHRAFPRVCEGSPRRQLSSLEKQLVFTLQQLSGFLVFRRFACYAANAMHFLLTRLLFLPAPAHVDVRAVLLGVFFADEHSSSSLPHAPAATHETTTTTTTTASGHRRPDDSSAGGRNPTSTLVVSRALNHLLHLVSFNLALQRGEVGRAAPAKPGSGYCTAATGTKLTLAAALLSVVLLLEASPRKGNGGVEEEHGPPCACGGVSVATVMARHNVYKCCEESPGFQTAVSAGLGRTHQVILFLSAVAARGDDSVAAAALVPVSTLRLEGTRLLAFSHLVHPNPPLPAALHRKAVESEAWAETLTVGVRSSASITAAAQRRRRKAEASFSCTLTCPVWPGTLKREHERCPGVRHGGGGVGDRALQVYVKAPQLEEFAGANTANGGGAQAAAAATPEESPPPMFFGYEPVSLRGISHAVGGGSSNHNNTGGIAGGNVPSAPSSLEKKMPPWRLDTIFVSRDARSPTCVVHNMPCTSSLQRSTMTYTAAADLTIVRVPCEGDADAEAEAQPFDAVILACSTKYGDELQLLSQPPHKFILSRHEEQERASSKLRGRSEEGELSQSRRDRRRRAARRRRRPSPSWAGPKRGKVLLCSVSRREQEAAAQHSPSGTGKSPPLTKKELGASSGNDSGGQRGHSCRGHGSDSDSDERHRKQHPYDDDKVFTDLDAYVASIKPVQAVDVGLQRREQEAALLQQQLEQSKAREEALRQRLQEVTEQREELISALADRRVEVELCHSEIIAPLRREVTLLRHSLSLRNQEMSSVISLCHTLRGENASMAAVVQDVRSNLENLVQNAKNHKHGG